MVVRYATESIARSFTQLFQLKEELTRKNGRMEERMGRKKAEWTEGGVDE